MNKGRGEIETGGLGKGRRAEKEARNVQQEQREDPHRKKSQEGDRPANPQKLVLSEVSNDRRRRGGYCSDDIQQPDRCGPSGRIDHFKRCGPQIGGVKTGTNPDDNQRQR